MYTICWSGHISCHAQPLVMHTPGTHIPLPHMPPAMHTLPCMPISPPPRNICCPAMHDPLPHTPLETFQRILHTAFYYYLDTFICKEMMHNVLLLETLYLCLALFNKAQEYFSLKTWNLSGNLHCRIKAGGTRDAIPSHFSHFHAIFGKNLAK